MKKLCVFPSDPIEEYLKKGEIKNQYYNPLNFFDEIHVMNPSYKKVDVGSVQIMGGNARMLIHSIGKVSLANMYFKKNKVLDIIRRIKPDLIRTYNPLVQGWVAFYCSKKLNLPYIVSLHGQYDKDIPNEYLQKKKYLKFLKLFLTKSITQKSVISNANFVICVYNHLISYAKENGAKNVEVVINQIDLEQFNKNINPAIKKDKPIIMNVGVLRKIKNQECLIYAIKNLDVYLVLIGDGEMYLELKNLTKKLGVENKVIFVKSVPHSQIQNYYASAKIFAIPSTAMGFPITALEALATRCVTVIAERFERKSEPIDSAVVYVKNNPKNFEQAFKDILENPKKYESYIETAQEILKTIDKKTMEEKEISFYKQYCNL